MGLAGPPAAFPFLGLTLLKDQTEGFAVPQAIARPWLYFSLWRDVLVPSPVCKMKVPGQIHPDYARPQLATWTWSNCGRSKAWFPNLLHKPNSSCSKVDLL